MPMPSSDEPPNEPPPVVEPVTAGATRPRSPSCDAATEPLSTDGIDPDTGLLDGAAFHRLIVQEDGRLRRYHRPATVVIFELDGLDRLAEHLGDRAAERVVAAMADSIRRLARGADHAARLGRGRFAVLLPETDEIAAIHYVERVRRASELWLESSAIAVRLAIGWAGTAGDPSLPDTQQVALERMYAELRRGARREDAAAASAPVQVAPATPESERPQLPTSRGRSRTAGRGRGQPRLLTLASRAATGGPRRSVDPEADPSTRRRAGVLAGVDDERAVDDDVLDAGREAARLVVRRVAPDRRRIEHDEVGQVAVADRAALAQPEPRGGRAGHLADRLLEAEQRLVAHELAEDARVAAVGPRAGLRPDEGRVRPDHPDRMARRTGGASRTTGRS